MNVLNFLCVCGGGGPMCHIWTLKNSKEPDVYSYDHICIHRYTTHPFKMGTALFVALGFIEGSCE